LNASLEAPIRERLEEFIFGADEETYEGFGRLLEKSGLKLGVVETAFGNPSARRSNDGRKRPFFAMHYDP
jgi:hypothetical protein